LQYFRVRIEDSTDPVVLALEPSYVETLAGCPLLWVSKLQTTTALLFDTFIKHDMENKIEKE
jgi:hypothetical protein